MTRPDKVQRHGVDETLLREVDGWVHHAADLDGDAEIRTTERDRPIALAQRLQTLKTSFGFPDLLTPSLIVRSERSLSPRRPYQNSPLSYLNAYGRSWTVLAEADRLEWAELGAPGARSGPMEIWFRNVAPGSTALVTIELTVGTTGPNVTGTFEVRSSAAAPRQFPVTGFNDHTVDLVVRPDSPYAVLVKVEPGTGIGYFAFREITYRTL